ncbi:CAP domain-containing protein [Sporosarcina sp. CAU 1771]
MKKSIAALLVSSALLLPNNNSAEASSFEGEVQVKKIQWVQHSSEWNAREFNFYLIELQKYINSQMYYGWSNTTNSEKEVVMQSPKPPSAKPVAPEPTAPVAKPTPSVPTTPVAKPTPSVPSTPVVKPAPVEKPTEVQQNASNSAVEQAVLDLTNAERQKAGLKSLQIDSKLMNSARQKSTDMATKNYFSHTSPTYGSPFDQLKANGVTYRSAAENIAMGQRSAAEVVQGWMDSPGHRQNILTSDFTHIGIGYDANGHYWTQQFITK